MPIRLNPLIIASIRVIGYLPYEFITPNRIFQGILMGEV